MAIELLVIPTRPRENSFGPEDQNHRKNAPTSRSLEMWLRFLRRSPFRWSSQLSNRFYGGPTNLGMINRMPTVKAPRIHPPRFTAITGHITVRQKAKDLSGKLNPEMRQNKGYIFRLLHVACIPTPLT
jgi:hypothetical protein